MTKIEQLVERMRQGDEAAWFLFMNEFGGLIFLVAKRMGLSKADQDDVFQTTCVSVYRHIHALQNPERLGSWVHRIAHRAALDLVTHRSRRESPTDAIAEIVTPRADDLAFPDAERAIERLELAGQIRALLGTLGARCRQVITALYLEDPPWSYDRIVREHGMPIGSIGPTRARCLDRLRRLLGASKLIE